MGKSVAVPIEKEDSHLRFNHACKNSNLLLKSLHFKPPTRLRQCFNPVRKFLNPRISNKHTKINNFKSLKEDMTLLIFYAGIILNCELRILLKKLRMLNVNLKKNIKKVTKMN